MKIEGNEKCHACLWVLASVMFRYLSGGIRVRIPRTRCRDFLVWILDVVVFQSWNLDVVAFCPLKKCLGITMLWVNCLCLSMLRYFGLRISMSWIFGLGQNYCIECCSTIFPFNSLSSNKKFLACCTNTDSNIIQWKDLENDHASSLSLKPSSNLELLVNQFSNTTPENSNDPEKMSSSKYYGIEEMHNIEILHNNKSLSLFRIKACSLNKKFDDLQHLLSCTKKNLI